MRALLVGLGSIGRRHLANLKKIEPDAFVTVWHQHAKAADCSNAVAGADHTVFALEEALETRPQVALITGPATLHVQTALDLVEHDVHLLIEKPLSNGLTGVDLLLSRCRDRELVLLVGYNFRFHKPLQMLRHALKEGRIGRAMFLRAEIGQYLPDWRKGADYRTGVSARSDLGGGALLELSHEIDWAQWLMGEVREVSAHLGRLSDLEIDVEDTAEIILEFESGALGSVHLDMIQRTPIRTCRIVGSEGTLVWDGIARQAAWYSAATREWVDLCPAGSTEHNDMYVDELSHFLDCVRGLATPVVSGEDGRRTLQVILAARQSSVQRRAVAL